MEPIEPSLEDRSRQSLVLAEILRCIREGETIKLPPFDPLRSCASELALLSVGIEENPFGGTVGAYRYQFEGEEDLLHLIVTRPDRAELTPQEGQAVAAFLLPNLPSALIWLKPGKFSQHFYFGHDELLDGA